MNTSLKNLKEIGICSVLACILVLISYFYYKELESHSDLALMKAAKTNEEKITLCDGVFPMTNIMNRSIRSPLVFLPIQEAGTEPAVKEICDSLHKQIKETKICTNPQLFDVVDGNEFVQPQSDNRRDFNNLTTPYKISVIKGKIPKNRAVSCN